LFALKSTNFKTLQNFVVTITRSFSSGSLDIANSDEAMSFPSQNFANCRLAALFVHSIQVSQSQDVN
jgi:hypothetical protein